MECDLFMDKKILIVEDEKDIAEVLKLYLDVEGYLIKVVDNGKKALDMMEKDKFDMVLVDIMMPVMNGYEFIKYVREYDVNLPIIIISAKSLDNDKIIGLNLGADMYITKPFNPLEVVANIKALFRRCSLLEKKENILKYDNRELNLNEFILKKNNNVINLTATELKILTKLMKNPNVIFTKTQLYECINGEYFENNENAMMVHISNIRSKIEDNASNPKYIKTIKRLGYKFVYEKK